MTTKVRNVPVLANLLNLVLVQCRSIYYSGTVSTTVNCQTLTTFGIHIYIYFGGVWKGFGSEYIYLSYTIDCNFIRVSRWSGGVWKGLGHDIYIYRRSKRCVSLALYGTDGPRGQKHTGTIKLRGL